MDINGNFDQINPMQVQEMEATFVKSETGDRDHEDEDTDAELENDGQVVPGDSGGYQNKDGVNGGQK